MRRWKLIRQFEDDDGTASIEFITAGLVLLVPLVYLILAMSAIQAGSLAVEGASRQAARVFVLGRTVTDAKASAQLAVDYALADYGVDAAHARVTITCAPHPSNCLTRRGFVTVTVVANVQLPLTPPALDLKTPLTIPLSATGTEQVSRFWGAG